MISKINQTINFIDIAVYGCKITLIYTRAEIIREVDRSEHLLKYFIK